MTVRWRRMLIAFYSSDSSPHFGLLKDGRRAERAVPVLPGGDSFVALGIGEIIGRAITFEIAAGEAQTFASFQDDSLIRIGEGIKERWHVVEISRASQRANRQETYFRLAATGELDKPSGTIFVHLLDDELCRITGQLVEGGLVALIDHGQ